MKEMISLSVAAIPAPTARSRRRQPSEAAARSLPRVERLKRKGPALHASPLSNDARVLSLNLAQGCGQRCPFCSVRAAPSYPGDDVVYLFDDNALRLEEELPLRRPKAVYISPSTDPFPPLAEVQAEAAGVVEVLARHGVASWLMTRGLIRPSALEVLTAHRESVRVTVALTTLNRAMQRVLEPWTAPPRLRLRQIARLSALGIPVQVALEPLVPGLTDTRSNLEEVLSALADVGVGHITAGYLFLRQTIRDNLQRALEPHGWDEVVLPEYQGGPLLESGTLAPARYLPKARRQRGYSMLMALAANHDMTVSVSGLTNPDFCPPRRPENVGLRQTMLPMFSR